MTLVVPLSLSAKLFVIHLSFTRKGDEMIGIDTNTWLVYEGVSNYGHGVWPSPVLTAATLIQAEEDWDNIPSSPRVEDSRLIFREDSFDPVSRIRRGRLYEWTDGALKQTWHFPPHPADPSDRLSMTIDGRLNRDLYTYRSVWGFSSKLTNKTRALLVLGTKSAPTVWRIVSAETIASGEELLTLHSRASFGALPEIIESHIPDEARQEVCSSLDHVADAAFRSSAVSLIDLCRAAITVILAHWLNSAGQTPNDIFHLDVGDLLKLLEERHPNQNEHSALKAAVRLMQRFHSRGKPNERKRYQTRPPSEEDAQLVLHALGFVLREIGWAR